MSEWEQVRIRDLARDGRSSFTDGDWIEAPHIKTVGIRLIQTGNISVGRFSNRTHKYISQESFDLLRCTEVVPGDILICRLADPIGRACIVPSLGQRFITSVDVCILRVDEERFDKQLVLQMLNTDEFLDRCNEVSGGTTRQRISRGNLGELTLDVPPLPHQRKIARILTTVDNLIEQTEALIEKYKSIKQGMMHDLFTRGVDQSGQLRPPYEDAPELYKESELGWIPKEWEVRYVSDVSSMITSGSRGWARYYSTSGAIFVRIGNLTRHHINFRWDDIQHVEPPQSAEGERTRLEEDDLLISVTADLGIIAIVPPDMGDAYINQHIALVRLRRDDVNSRWVGHFLAGTNGRYQFERLSDVGAKAGLNLPTVGSLSFLYPTLSEQNQLVEIVDGLDEQVKIEQKQLAKSRKLKSGLMQDLLTGKVRVNVDETEDSNHPTESVSCGVGL
jgi:type I restriction enzyme S subunit